MRRTTLVQLGAALLGAALLTAAFPPFGEAAAVAVALAPLLALSRLTAPKRAAALWFAGGFVFWFGTLAWMPAICKNNGPWPLVALGWAGLAAVCAAYFALFGWLSARAWRRFGRGALLLEPVLWAGCEWLRATLFTGFAWNFMGTAVAAVPGFALPARLGGVYLVSALAVAVNGVFATLACRLVAQMRPAETDPDAARSPGALRWRRALETALPLALVTAVMFLARPPRAEGERVPLRVALVQRNAPCIFTRDTPRVDPFEVYGNLMAVAAAARPDLVVWGESALAEFGRVDSAGARRAAAFVRDLTGGALLAGGDHVELQPDGSRRYYNAAVLYTIGTDLSAKGTDPQHIGTDPQQVGTDLRVREQIYHKQHLVPFGEYIPFDKWIPALQKLSPIGVSLYPGTTRLLELPYRGDTNRCVRLAPLICFEDTDPTLSRAAAAAGAHAIVLITNDSWFSNSSEPVQHAAQAVLRAVETGLPVIRTGNSGVTGVITPSGQTRWLTDGARPLTDTPGCQLETIPLSLAPHPSSPTPYTRLGDLPLLSLFTLSLLLLFLPRRRSN